MSGMTTGDRHFRHRALFDHGEAVVFEADQSDDVKLQPEHNWILVERPEDAEGGDDYDIELPPVANCKGMSFIVKMVDPDDDGDKTVTVKTLADGAGAPLKYDLAADGDYVVIENVAGIAWRVLDTYTGSALHEDLEIAAENETDVTLTAHQTLVKCLDAGGSGYDITLPSLAGSKNTRFTVYRATGSTGTINVKTPAGGYGKADTTWAMTAANDYVVVENVEGLVWVEVDEETT